tara:strand:+ start:484 stop:768 length:285 start_codon:yes stop_codon:yes gene_type:complete
VAFTFAACTFTVASSLDLTFMVAIVSVILDFKNCLKEVCFLHHCCCQSYFVVVTFKASVDIITFDSYYLEIVDHLRNFNQLVACFIVNQIPIVG